MPAHSRQPDDGAVCCAARTGIRRRVSYFLIAHVPDGALRVGLLLCLLAAAAIPARGRKPIKGRLKRFTEAICSARIAAPLLWTLGSARACRPAESTTPEPGQHRDPRGRRSSPDQRVDLCQYTGAIRAQIAQARDAGRRPPPPTLAGSTPGSRHIGLKAAVPSGSSNHPMRSRCAPETDAAPSAWTRSPALQRACPQPTRRSLPHRPEPRSSCAPTAGARALIRPDGDPDAPALDHGPAAVRVLARGRGPDRRLQHRCADRPAQTARAEGRPRLLSRATTRCSADAQRALPAAGAGGARAAFEVHRRGDDDRAQRRGGDRRTHRSPRSRAVVEQAGDIDQHRTVRAATVVARTSGACCCRSSRSARSLTAAPAGHLAVRLWCCLGVAAGVAGQKQRRSRSGVALVSARRGHADAAVAGAAHLPIVRWNTQAGDRRSAPRAADLRNTQAGASALRDLRSSQVLRLRRTAAGAADAAQRRRVDGAVI